MNDNHPLLSPSAQAGSGLAEKMIRNLLAQAADHPNLAGENVVLRVESEVRIPADRAARRAFVDAFWSLMKTNTGLRTAEHVGWEFTLSAGYMGPAEFTGEATGLPAEYRKPPLLTPVIFAEDPCATFSMSLHSVFLRGPAEVEK